MQKVAAIGPMAEPRSGGMLLGLLPKSHLGTETYRERASPIAGPSQAKFNFAPKERSQVQLENEGSRGTEPVPAYLT